MYAFVWTDEEGGVTVEYALLLALLVVAAVGVWTTFEQKTRAVISGSTNALVNAMAG